MFQVDITWVRVDLAACLRLTWLAYSPFRNALPVKQHCVELLKGSNFKTRAHTTWQRPRSGSASHTYVMPKYSRDDSFVIWVRGHRRFQHCLGKAPRRARGRAPSIHARGLEA